MGGKDSQKRVVERFWLRGGLKSTRYGVVVVEGLVSCLGYVARMGMIIKRFGCEECGKGSYLIKKGGIRWSNGLGLQDNDRSWDQPKNIFVWNQIAERGFEIPVELKERMEGRG